VGFFLNSIIKGFSWKGKLFSLELKRGSFFWGEGFWGQQLFGHLNSGKGTNFGLWGWVLFKNFLFFKGPKFSSFNLTPEKNSFLGLGWGSLKGKRVPKVFPFKFFKGP